MYDSDSHIKRLYGGLQQCHTNKYRGLSIQVSQKSHMNSSKTYSASVISKIEPTNEKWLFKGVEIKS